MNFVLQLSIWDLALKSVIFVNIPNLNVLLDPWDKAVSHILEKYITAINTYLDLCLITLVHMTNNYLGQSSLKIKTIWCHGVTSNLMIPLFSVSHPYSLIMNLTHCYEKWDSRVYVCIWKMACLGSHSCTSGFE